MNKQRAKEQLTKNIINALLCGAICVGSAVPAMAAVPADEYELDNVIVTAERIPTKKAETPANVTVITAQQIEDNHYQNMAEVLEQINGVRVTRQGSGTQDIVRLNGDDRVVVLIDGRRMNNDQGTGIGRAGFDLNTIPTMKNIERIEVVKGGGSALYGSDAVGGVINIITKKVKQNSTTLDMNTGSWGTHNYEITTEGSNGDDLSWSVSGGIQKRSYFKYKYDGQTKRMDSSDYNNNALAVKLDKKINDSSSLTLNVEHRKVDSNQFYYSSYSGGFIPSVPMKKLTNNWALTYNFKENTEAPAYLRVFDNYTTTDFAGVFNTRLQGVDYQNGWKLDDKNRMIAGLEWHESKSTNEASGYKDKKITNKAVYLQDTMQMSDKWSFVPGVRVDNHSKFGTHTTPKAALNYQADKKTQVYASWGRVYAAPQADDLYYYADYSPYGGYYGNPNLKPESGHTETLGVNHQFDAKKSIQLSLFNSEVHDAIRWYSADFMNYYAMNVNYEKKHGFEISFQNKLTDEFSYDIGYSYIRTELDKNDGNGLVWENSNSQPNGYRLGLHYKKDSWKANLLGTAGAGRDTTVFGNRSYLKLDFNVSYDFNKQMTGYFKVNNLTNQQYSEYKSKFYPGTGRFYQVGLQYHF